MTGDAPPRVRLESQVEKAIVEHAAARGWLVYKIMRANRRGLPDRVFIRGGAHVWMEVKRQGEKARKQQLLRHAEMRAAGAAVYVVDDLAAAVEILS